MDEIIIRIIGNAVKFAEVISENPRLTVQEKLLHIIMKIPPYINKKEQVLEQLHKVENAQMHQKSLVLTTLRLTPIITKIIEQEIKEELFSTPYPKESVECLLVSSQFLFNEGLFQCEREELVQKIQAYIYMMEKMQGAKEGSLSYVRKLFE